MRKLIAICVICLMTAVSANAAMTVTTLDDGETAAGLAAALLGPGVTISNISYTGNVNSAGTYTVSGTDVFGTGDGVVLSSGNADLAEDVDNNLDSAGTSYAGAGDSDLTGLLGGSYVTHDATILEFDFQLGDGTVEGDVFINFVWASEEYNEWVDSAYNDVFGFFVDGTNIALVGTDPISIDTVNPGDNAALYNNNDLTDFGYPTPYATEFDGFTDLFTVSALDLAPGIHHMKIGVADAGDWVYDSAVFIQGSSLSDTPVDPVPAPGAFLLAGIGLAYSHLKMRRRREV